MLETVVEHRKHRFLISLTENGYDNYYFYNLGVQTFHSLFYFFYVLVLYSWGN